MHGLGEISQWQDPHYHSCAWEINTLKTTEIAGAVQKDVATCSVAFTQQQGHMALWLITSARAFQEQIQHRSSY